MTTQSSSVTDHSAVTRASIALLIAISVFARPAAHAQTPIPLISTGAVWKYCDTGLTTSDEATLMVLPVPTEPGSLDLTFDPTAGGTQPGFGGDDPAVNAVIVQSDGKILAGGSFTSFNGVPHTRLARLQPDGQLDETS